MKSLAWLAVSFQYSRIKNHHFQFLIEELQSDR